LLSLRGIVKVFLRVEHTLMRDRRIYSIYVVAYD
jgi:hypothetical protein